MIMNTSGVDKKGCNEESKCEDCGYDSADAICTFPLIFFDWKVSECVNIIFEHFYLIN